MLAERDGFTLKDRTVGIVGVGNVGGRLQKRLEAWGIRTLLCDPPRKDNGDEGDFRTLDELVDECDVITFHTPLFKEGPYKTLHGRRKADPPSEGWHYSDKCLPGTGGG